MQSITEVARGLGAMVRAAIEYGGDPEQRALRERIWDGLDPSLKTETQMFGTRAVGCYATHNVYEGCDFSCTACYLSKGANQTPALPFEEVKAQLDFIRAHAGPGANVQVTAGEVTLLPVEDLIRIVRYASDELRLDVMVMSHGQTFDRDPSYLERLVVEGGCRKVAIHIDTTQRGRDGHHKSMSEKDLHPIRDRFADLIRETRRRTGIHLHAAHTVTVTESNLEEVPEIARWMVRNSDAFRMVSFQPTADVGRTREREMVGRRELVWSKVAEGMGLEAINPTTFTLGHPHCNNVNLSWVIRFGDEAHVMEVVRPDEALDAWFWRELMSGAFKAGLHSDGDAWGGAGDVLGMFVRSPKYLWQWPGYSALRCWTEREWFSRFLKALAGGESVSVRPLVTVLHNFMSAHELETPIGQARLEACAFKLPVDGRMVSMCEMNGTDLRERTNERTKDLVALRTGPSDPR